MTNLEHYGFWNILFRCKQERNNPEIVYVDILYKSKHSEPILIDRGVTKIDDLTDYKTRWLLEEYESNHEKIIECFPYTDLVFMKHLKWS